MKIAINDRDDKVKWREEYFRLRTEENELSIELEQWMEQHKDWIIPASIPYSDTTDKPTVDTQSPLEAEASSLFLSPSSSSTSSSMYELLSTVIENKYTITLQKRTLDQHIVRLHTILAQCKNNARGVSSSSSSSAADFYVTAQKELQSTILYFENMAQELYSEMNVVNDSIMKNKSLSHNNDNNDLDTDNRNVLAKIASPTSTTKNSADVSSSSSSSPSTSISSPSSPNRQSTDQLLRNQCVSILNTVGGSSCEDNSLFTQLVEGFLSLEKQYRKDLHDFLHHYQNVCDSCGTRIDQDYGGWTQDAHLAYKQALQFNKSKAGAGKTRINRYLNHKQQFERIREQNNHSRSTLESIQDTVPNTEPSVPYKEDEDETFLPSSSSATNTLIESNDEFYDTVRLLVYEITQRSFNPSRTMVEQHHRWTNEQKLYKQRKSAREAQYTRERKEYIDQARRSFDKATILAENLRIRAKTLAEHEKIRQETHQRLEVGRARKAVEDAIARSIADEMSAAETAVQELNSLARKARAEKMKKALERYYADQTEIERRIDEVKQQQALADLERKKEQAVTDHERIEYRAKLITQKMDHAKQLAAEATELERQKELLLEKFIKNNVDYYERIEEIANTTDKERVNAHTVASKTSTEISLAYAYYIKAVHNHQTMVNDDVTKKVTSHDNVDFAIAAKYAPDRPDGVPDTSTTMNPSKAVLLSLANQRIKEKGLFGKFGYSEKQVTGDKRWRFVSSAWAAGIQGTSAARDALHSIKPTGRGVLQVNQATTSQISW